MRPFHRHEPSLTGHVYRDSALIHGVLALVILGIALGTSQSATRIVLLPVGYFVLATGWTWWRLRERSRTADEQEAS